MKIYTAVSLAALAVLIAVASGTASAANNVSNGTTTCNVVSADYELDSWSNEQYPVINLFGEKYVPLFSKDDDIWDSHVNKLATLVLDSNETHTLKPGENVDLGHGYVLKVKQINIDDVEVWLELTRNGQYITDQIVSVSTDDNKTWTVTLDNVQGENNVVVMKVYVNNIFVGAEDCIVRIDGIWLIDYANARTLNIGDKFGGFTLKQIASGVDASNMGSLVFENTAGFTTESSAICSVVGTNYECNSWSDEQYPVINLFGEEYIPLFSKDDDVWDSHVNKLATLVLDSNETHTLKPGENVDLGNGYTLEVREIDIDGENVWLELTRGGQHVADKNVSIDTDDNQTWTVTLDNVQGENNVVVMKVHVKQLFVGAEISVVQIDGIWLIDYANSRTLNIGDKFGEFTLEEIISGVDKSNLGSLVFENTSAPANTLVADNASLADDDHLSDSSASHFPEKGHVKITGENKGSPTFCIWDFWRHITIKNKQVF